MCKCSRAGKLCSYLHVLNEESSALAIGALSALPTASTPDATNAALTAHTVSITCC